MGEREKKGVDQKRRGEELAKYGVDFMRGGEKQSTIATVVVGNSSKQARNGFE